MIKKNGALHINHMFMEKRIIRNSSNLQKLFAKEYEDFFAANNLIVSGPHVISRWNVTHLKDLKVKIAQKIPTKTYLGINIRKDDSIHLKTVTRFINAQQKFETHDTKMIIGKEFAEKLEHTIKDKLAEQGCNKWLDIAFFSENEKDTGTQNYSVMILIISLMIHILSGKLTLEEISDYDDFIKSGKFKEVYATAKEILESIAPVPKEHICTTPIFTAGINNGNICFNLESKEYLQATYPKLMKIDNNICMNHFDKDVNQHINNLIEFSIISFGWFFNEFYNTKTYLDIEASYEKTFKHYKMNSAKLNLCAEMITLLYLKMFESAKEAIKYPNDEHLMNHFFWRINRVWMHQAFIEKYVDLYRDITATFKKNMVFEDEKMGLIPISSAKLWGTFICITKSEKSRETLEKMIYRLHEMWYTTANFQYFSRKDGISEEHLKVEQYLDQDCFSSHIKKGDVMLECWSYDWTKTIGNHRKLLEETKDSIIFDTIDGKIYLNNEITNHNEILTQSGTVEIIKVLFENMWEYVNNSKLPSSSYSKNKNEITGKIIWPLQDLIQKRYNGRLDLQCTGSIVNFDLKLSPNKINICLIKRIWIE